jgi:hypothetical protein
LSLRRTFMYASLLGTSGALHPDVFDQPAGRILYQYSTIPLFQGSIS